MKQIFVLSVLLFSFSIVNGQDVELPKSAKSDAVALYGEEIKMKEEHIYALSYKVLKDSLILIHNRESENVTSLEVYGLKSKTLINSLFPYGRGPGEAISLSSYTCGDGVVAMSWSLNKYVSIDFNSLSKPGFKPTFTSQSVFSGMKPYDDSKFVTYNEFYFEDKKSGIKNGNEMGKVFFVPKGDRGRSWNLSGSHQYNTTGVVGGFIAVNKDKGVIVYADRFRPIIELYDSQLKLKKRITTGDNLDVKYVATKQYGNLVGFIPSPMAFSDVVYDDDFFYVAYIGAYNDFQNKLQNDYPSWIFKFDWDGNLVKSYKYDKKIENLSLSEKEDTFYISSFDDDDIQILVKLTTK